MGDFVIRKDEDKIKSINRTVRMKPEHYERLMEISQKTGVSFNKVLVQCLEYALDHFDDDE